MSQPIPLSCYYRNKKSKAVYFAFGLAENMTNKNVGQVMICYRDIGEAPSKVYVREASEFVAKFDRVPDSEVDKLDNP